MLLDEICGWVVVRKLQTSGVTSKMETRFRKPVSTKDSHVVLRASIREQKRNIVIIDAKLYNEAGEVCSEAVCTATMRTSISHQSKHITFPKEKAEQEMHFHHCDVEKEEILPLI